MDTVEKINELKIKFLDMLADLNTVSPINKPQILYKSIPPKNPLNPDKTKRQNKLGLNQQKKLKSEIDQFLEKYLPKTTVVTDTSEDPFISENILIRDILLNLEGASGDFIKFSIDEKRFVFDKKKLNESDKNCLGSLCDNAKLAALRCCEPGLYFKKINKQLKRHKEALASDRLNLSKECGKRVGLVEQRFYSVVEEDLEGHYGFIAQTESILKGNVSTDKIPEIQPPLTILKLLHLTEPKCRDLKALLIICKAAKSLKGAALCSELHQLSLCSDQSISAQALKYFSRCSDALWGIIFQWLLKGEVNDPFEEFFVMASPPGFPSKFCVRAEMAPSFISEKAVAKMLKIGATVDYIASHAEGEVGRLDCDFAKQETVIENPSSIEAALLKIEKRVGDHFLAILFDKFSFRAHFANINAFIFLRQGDFVDHLLSLSLEIMTSSSKSDQGELLNPLIQKALFESNKENSSLDFELVFSKLDNENAIDILDSFSLVYKLESQNPLNIIFRGSFTKKYKQIFNFLWKIKFASKSLICSFLRCTQCSKSGHNKRFSLLNNKMLLLSFKMCSVLNRLQQLFFSGAVQPSFDSFMADCNKSRAINELIELHCAFLDNLLHKLFLDKNQIYHLIICLVKIAIEFSRQTFSFHDSVKLMVSESKRETLSFGEGKAVTLLKTTVRLIDSYSESFDKYYVGIVELFKNISVTF